MNRRTLARAVLAYFLAVGVAYGLGSIASTQTVLFSLEKLGLSVPGDVRLQTTIRDLVNLAPVYGPIVALSMLVAMLVSAKLGRLWPNARAGLFIISGATAIVAVHLILRAVYGISPLPATRSAVGLLIQSATGAIAGVCCVVVLGRADR